MITTEESKKIDNGWRALIFVWIAMMMSLFMYLLVGLLTEDTIDIPMEKSVFEILRNILYFISFVTLIATKYIMKLNLSGKGINLDKAVQQKSNQNTQSTAVAKYTVAMMISLAMSESIAIYALILFFAGKNRLDLYLLILISAAAMFYYRPNKEEIIKIAEESNQQTDKFG
jgi:hypothetical protein